MAESKDLFNLLYLTYAPFLSQCTSDASCQRLLTDRNLSLQELLQMQRDNIYCRFPEAYQLCSSLFLVGRIAYAALEANPFDVYALEIFLKYTDHLRSNEPSLNLSLDTSTCLSKLISLMLITEELSQMNSVYEGLQQIKARGFLENPEIYENTAEDKYVMILNSLHSRSGFDSVKEQLEGLVKMKELQVSFPYENYKILAVSLAFVEIQDRSDVEKKEILDLVDRLQVQSETVNQTLVQLKQDLAISLSMRPEYNIPSNAQVSQSYSPVLQNSGVLNTNVQMSNSYNPNIGVNAPEVTDLIARDRLGGLILEEPLPDAPMLWITQKDQISLQPLNLFSNTSGDVHMYVWKGKCIIQGSEYQVAVKEYYAVSHEELRSYYDREYKILALLSGKKNCFLHCFGSYSMIVEHRQCFGIVMELCQMNLMDYINQRKTSNNPLNEDELKQIFSTLLEGFEFLAQNRIYHYDVKPHNILLTSNGHLKIADFNVSKIFDENTFVTTVASANTLQGTSGYMPPEIQKYNDEFTMRKQDEKLTYRPSRVDVYSLGLTFLQLCTLESVFGLNKLENQHILVQTLEGLPILWVRNLLQNMLVFDYKDRKSMKEMMAYLPDQETVKQS